MTLKELQERQSWSLEQKIDHSLGTLEAFISRMGGIDKVYVSFSGGKDSTVLLHLARILYPDILAVFCNTGNEYPDIIRFVRQMQADGANIQFIRPKFTPRQVWEKYGFPLVSKEISQSIHEIRTNPNSPTSIKRLNNEQFALSKCWRFLITQKFNTCHKCCKVLKKAPFHKWEKDSGRSPILGVMASESQLREKDYIRHGGCNVFAGKGRSKSMSLSIWLEQDIWDYIAKCNLPIADIYHKGATRTGCMGCGFGAQFADDTRFRTLLREYPKCYDMVMNYTNNGVTFREALRKVLAVNRLYLPDEEPPTLFDFNN
ncbi:MAG: phosphoadenosine phosphosulfate reductase family protein [Muribaculaceae bacterium]|nr:phosphoadenosine phosphosulfate reductase family protein [Muribaculaceae bacterium]